MAAWAVGNKNVGEPCDIGNSGYNAARGKGADRSDNRKYGFNRSGVREYCVNKNVKFNFQMNDKAKVQSYKWCCIYMESIDGKMSPLKKNQCTKAGHFPIEE